MENLTLNSESNPQGFLVLLQTLTPFKNILIAYSGGLDSHVLLHLASKLSQPHHYSIRAMHIHHGLQKIADTWVPHCQRVCDQLNIPLKTHYLNLDIDKGKSVEEEARSARYAALKASLQKDEVLLTAHHQNDQAETLLLQLFRGAGVQGLAGMPLITNFGLGQHARPLLNASRQSLEIYAKENQLNFIEDPSNQDNAFDRNYLRNEILPKLRDRWLGIDKTISRSARLQAETKQLLDEFAEQDMQSLQDETDATDTLLISKLKPFSVVRQKLLLRHWIVINGFTSPSEKKLKHIFSDVINASDDAQPLVEWRGAEVRRYQGRLYIMKPMHSHDNTQVFEWINLQNPLSITSLGITIDTLSPSLYDKELPMTVRFRQGGEKIQHEKRGVAISLKNLLNESGVPPWQRSRVPLIYSGETLIKVVGIA